VINQDTGHDVQIQSVDGKFMQRNFLVAPLSWYINFLLCNYFFHVLSIISDCAIVSFLVLSTISDCVFALFLVVSTISDCAIVFFHGLNTKFRSHVCCYFQVVSIGSSHTCASTSQVRGKEASKAWIADRATDVLKSTPDLGANKLQVKLERQFSIKMPYNKV
jgi:hypothetical protein